MKSMKKLLAFGMTACLTVGMLAGCNSDGGNGGEFNQDETISVVSREEGSGTRGAFVELFGVEQEDENGETVDMTTPEAITNNQTSVVMTTVAGDEYAIGYISMGSLDDTVKALQIDGVDATVDNINSGDYTVSRPFNIATQADVSAGAQDFINFIMSADGQAVIEEEGYIPVSEGESFSSAMPSGRIVVAGSSSVSPVMQLLIEAYNEINPDLTIELQQSDSTTGINYAIDGTADIGMASRELDDSEISAGLTPTVIAMDGIAVIVNNDNPLDGLTTEQVRDIYTGEITTWADVME